MLGLIFIYFIGRAFYRLAEEHNRIKWLWAVIGVVSYYAIGFIVGITFALFNLDWAVENEIILSLIGIGAGIGGIILFYHLLGKNWEKNVPLDVDVEILDQ